ncbi:hypothetical protein IWW42_005708 [Coemansia sp. RSA 1085]|nr:hypothetical protein IWW42_005708 [Coemansia sp. RSA 1085]
MARARSTNGWLFAPVRTTHTGSFADSLTQQQPVKDDEIAQLVSELLKQLGDKSASVPQVWSTYDRLKIKRVLLFIPYESWLDLLKTCQRDPRSNRSLSGNLAKSAASSNSPGSLPSVLDEFKTDERLLWTRKLSKRRALMFLGDMWRYSGMTRPSTRRDDIEAIVDTRLPGSGIAASSLRSIWRPTAYHYNIALDAVSRDDSSKIEELMLLYRDMRAHSIQEDTITFNTLLSGCRRLRAWEHFRQVDDQVRKRSKWGITHMDATTWGTLIRGYRECKDWEAVDKCVAKVTSACHVWYRLHSKGDAVEGGLEPKPGLWNAIINVYASRDMVPQMIAARRVMQGLGLSMDAYTFAPILGALHRMRRSLTRQKKDTWPAVDLALSEYEVMCECNVKLNETMLTSLALTVGLSNNFASSDQGQNKPDERVLDRIRAVDSKVARELEAMLTHTHDPHTFAALLNLGGKSGALDDIRAVWSTLISKAKFSESTQSFLTSLTLAAYMNALIDCKQYEDAISAFHTHALPLRSSITPKGRAHVAQPRLKTIDKSVYDAALRAFALADRHRMCVQIMSRMVNSGNPPNALSIRYSLLPPEREKLHASRYTRRWSLPLHVARSIWDIVIESRRRGWARGQSSPTSANSLPVIVNDIAAQLIRIAAYARNIEFGEEVFEALKKEAAFFGMKSQSIHLDGEDVDRPATTDSRFPEDLQCAPNVRTYTAMVTLYCNVADLTGVSNIWAQMINDGIEPTLHTYTSLIAALHKVALRKRWRQSREYAEQNPQLAGSALELSDNSSAGEDPNPSNMDHIWMPTAHDTTIKRVEDQVIGSASGSESDEFQQEQPSSFKRLSLDIPLSTLLLRYHSSRIYDVVSNESQYQSTATTSIDKNIIADIERALQICRVVEEKGLKPDARFHAALADFFSVCGDEKSAELVRKQMDHE